MRIENSFEVPATPERAWDLLMDVPRVVPCMPGAELLETVDDSNWKAKVAVKLGPISLAFNADVNRAEVDEAARQVVLKVKARETRGRGGAQASIANSLEAIDGGTRVDSVTDLSLSGSVAQYGRGAVQDVSAQLIGQFANCLKAQLQASTPEEAQAAIEAHSKPVSGLSLMWRALLAEIKRLLGMRR